MPTVYKVYKGSRFRIWNWDGEIEIVGQVYEKHQVLEVAFIYQNIGSVKFWTGIMHIQIQQK